MESSSFTGSYPLQLRVKYLDDLTRLNDSQDSNDFANHGAVCFESVVRCSEDDDSDRGPFMDC